MTEDLIQNLNKNLPDFLENIQFEKTTDVLQKISQLPREKVIDMDAEQRNLIALDLLEKGVKAVDGTMGIGHPNKEDLAKIGIEYGVLAAIYKDFASRSTRNTTPVSISRNEEMAVDLMGGMCKHYPEIDIMTGVTMGTFAKQTFEGTERAKK